MACQAGSAGSERVSTPPTSTRTHQKRKQMQLTAERDPLLDALQTAARALSTRTTLPSLGGIMLVAEGGTAVARATDGELGVTVALDARGGGRRPDPAARAGCSPTSPGRCPRARVTLSERPRAARRRADRPAPPTSTCACSTPRTSRACPSSGRSSITMPAAALAETVDRVARAASRDEVRPILTGIMVSVEELDPDDGRHRLLPALGQADRARAGAPRRPFEANVPARAMRELARVVSQNGVEEVRDLAARQPGRLRAPATCGSPRG